MNHAKPLATSFMVLICVMTVHVSLWATEGEILWQREEVGETLEATCVIDHESNVYVVDSKFLWSFDTHGKLRWRYKGGVGDSSSAVLGRNNDVFFANSKGIYAVNATTGEELWHNTKGFKAGFHTNPAISEDGSRLYIGQGDNLNPSDEFHAIDARSGKVIWTYDNPHPALEDDIRGYLGGASIGPDGTIFIGSQHGWLISLTDEGKTYKENWAQPIGKEMRMPPIMDGKGHIIATSNAGVLRKFHAQTGREMKTWNSETQTGWPFPVGQDPKKCCLEIFVTPVIGPDGTIYVGTEDSFMYAIKPEGKIKWQFRTVSWHGDPLLRADGALIYTAEMTTHGDKKGYVVCLDKDGFLNWTTPITRNIVLNEMGVSLAPNGTIYVTGGENGVLFAIKGNGLGLADSPWPKYQKDITCSGNFNISSPSKALPATTCHVSHLRCIETINKQGEIIHAVEVEVRDNLGALVSDAIISTSFTKGITFDRKERTHSTGKTIIAAPKQKEKANYTFCIKGIQHESLAYHEKDNVMTCINNN